MALYRLQVKDFIEQLYELSWFFCIININFHTTSKFCKRTSIQRNFLSYSQALTHLRLSFSLGWHLLLMSFEASQLIFIHPHPFPSRRVCLRLKPFLQKKNAFFIPVGLSFARITRIMKANNTNSKRTQLRWTAFFPIENPKKCRS